MTTNTKTEIRRFNENDWNGLGGAEKFSDGSDPFITEIRLIDSETGKEFEEVVLTGDGNGVGIVAWDVETDRGVEFHLTCVLPPFAMENLLRGIASYEKTYTETLFENGFIREDF